MSSAFSLSTSESLIGRVRDVEPGAWDVLLRLYGPLVYRFARQAGLQRQDAADTVQTVFLSVWQGMHNFTLDRPDASFRGWLRTITRNSVHELRRRQESAPTFVPELREIADPQLESPSDDELSDNSSNQLFSGLTHQALQLVRQTVDDLTWDAFWSTAMNDQPVSDVAQALGLSAAAVRQAKYRVLCRLRVLLADR